jgi:hypothetical protein
MFECELREIKREFYKSDKPKYGIYSGSCLWSVKGFGSKVWGVSVRIDLDYESAKQKYATDDEIVEQCIHYLNMPPKSKYGKRRMRKPLYEFESTPYSYSIKEKEGKTCISAMLLIKQKKNKYFWGQGEKYL